MIDIREKTGDDIILEREFNVKHGINKKICDNYIIDSTGNKFDIDNLSENQVIELIKYDLMDFFAPEGSYKKNYRVKLDSFILAELVRDKYVPSVRGAYEIYRLIPTYGEIMFKLLNDFGYMNIIQRAVIIAKYYKESNNDFNAILYKEMIAVLEQMTNNEAEREYLVKKRFK